MFFLLIISFRWSFGWSFCCVVRGGFCLGIVWVLIQVFWVWFGILVRRISYFLLILWFILGICFRCLLAFRLRFVGVRIGRCFWLLWVWLELIRSSFLPLGGRLWLVLFVVLRSRIFLPIILCLFQDRIGVRVFRFLGCWFVFWGLRFFRWRIFCFQIDWIWDHGVKRLGIRFVR